MIKFFLGFFIGILFAHVIHRNDPVIVTYDDKNQISGVYKNFDLAQAAQPRASAYVPMFSDWMQ